MKLQVNYKIYLKIFFVYNKMPSKKKKRCANCNKKLGLIPFTCRCGNDYCAKCICTSIHNCTFDFFYHNKKIIESNVGGGEFQKFEKIK